MKVLPEQEDDNMLYPLRHITYGNYRNGWRDIVEHMYTKKRYIVAQHHIHYYGNQSDVYYCVASQATEVTT